jgi:hypothetical protein
VPAQSRTESVAAIGGSQPAAQAELIDGLQALQSLRPGELVARPLRRLGAGSQQ